MVEQRSPKPRAEGSSPSAPAKPKSRINTAFMRDFIAILCSARGLKIAVRGSFDAYLVFKSSGFAAYFPYFPSRTSSKEHHFNVVQRIKLRTQNLSRNPQTNGQVTMTCPFVIHQNRRSIQQKGNVYYYSIWRMSTQSEYTLHTRKPKPKYR